MHRTNPDFTEALVLTVPRLRAFAISLTGNLDRADDLVQETVLRAIENVDRFEEGTSLQSWTFTILETCFSRNVASAGAK